LESPGSEEKDTLFGNLKSTGGLIIVRYLRSKRGDNLHVSWLVGEEKIAGHESIQGSANTQWGSLAKEEQKYKRKCVARKLEAGSARPGQHLWSI